MQTTPGTPLSDDTTADSSPAGSRKTTLWAAVAAVVCLVDQATKWWAERALDDGQVVQLLGGWLRLRLVHNPGAAFSLGTGYTLVLTMVALVVIAVCIKMARRLGSRGWAVALGLLLGGALGNMTDRIFRNPSPFRGHVVDFLELPNWPVFNLADTAICTAAALFVVLSLRGVRLDGTIVGKP
ncbi:MAG: signal peptidase II [Nocardioidaceae bacterium]|nr:signal peptidase II [Nocardioidaceae bacterium]